MVRPQRRCTFSAAIRVLKTGILVAAVLRMSQDWVHRTNPRTQEVAA
jgi:hypothetical protein